MDHAGPAESRKDTHEQLERRQPDRDKKKVRKSKLRDAYWQARYAVHRIPGALPSWISRHASADEH
jgi:hypothetical protein